MLCDCVSFPFLSLVVDVDVDVDVALAVGVGVTVAIITNLTHSLIHLLTGTLDYLLYSPMRIRLMSVAAIPTEQEIVPESGRGLPSAVYPSDHMMLCVDVALSITGSGSVVNNNNNNSNTRNGGHGGYGRKTGVNTQGQSRLGSQRNSGMR